jgi:hypothetical protein
MRPSVGGQGKAGFHSEPSWSSNADATLGWCGTPRSRWPEGSRVRRCRVLRRVKMMLFESETIQWLLNSVNDFLKFLPLLIVARYLDWC